MIARRARLAGTSRVANLHRCRCSGTNTASTYSPSVRRLLGRGVPPGALSFLPHPPPLPPPLPPTPAFPHQITDAPSLSATTSLSAARATAVRSRWAAFLLSCAFAVPGDDGRAGLSRAAFFLSHHPSVSTHIVTAPRNATGLLLLQANPFSHAPRPHSVSCCL